MFSIGQLTRISGLSIEAPHLSHEEGFLAPRLIDDGYGYHYDIQKRGKS